LAFNLYSIQEILELLASQVKQARLNQDLSQDGLAKRSGVSLGSIKRFERSGQISLESLIKIAVVLNALEDFTKLFLGSSKPIRSLDEILANNSKVKQRGRIK